MTPRPERHELVFSSRAWRLLVSHYKVRYRLCGRTLTEELIARYPTRPFRDGIAALVRELRALGRHQEE